MEVYGNDLKTFCKNYSEQQKSKKAISNKLRDITGHPTGASIAKQPVNRNIDRMNSINTKSAEPFRVPKIADLMKEVEQEGILHHATNKPA